MRVETFCAALLVTAGLSAMATHSIDEAASHAGAPAIHYAPAESLEPLDAALIGRATRTIDLAAYVLTDGPILAALDHAAARGVTIRILLDREQHGRRAEVPALAALRARPGVTIRIKATDTYMHMKSYAVDARWLRTGAANFSGSGLTQQDNDFVTIDSPALAEGFAANFARIFERGVAE